ncbi:MAG: molybdopterin-dependent oxidoreductase, partial [Thermoplasmata archaeon]|nr:molybdopterin-dependent oxidoreductase [Thermoplasmata archaeon]
MPPVGALPDDAVIRGFRIPYTGPREYVQTHRVARRPQMSHPIVNAGVRVRLDERGRVEPGAATIVYGGLAPMIVRAGKTERFLAGKPWDRETLRSALEVLGEEVGEWTDTLPTIDEEGIGRDYRRRLAGDFFYKSFLHVARSVDPGQVAPEHVSAAEPAERPLSTGVQEHTEYPELYPLTRPIIKRAAWAQATGEARYTHDLSLPAGGLHAAMVKSARPHARFRFGDRAADLDLLGTLLQERFPGFRAFITAADIPEGGHHLIGLGADDPVFSAGVVTSVGAPIGLAVAETIETARAAAAFIEEKCLAYDDLPAVVTLDDAIAQGTAMPMIRKAGDPDEDIQQRIPALTRPGSDLDWLGDPSRPLGGSELATGTLRTGAQAHFYLETLCALAIPGPEDQMTVYNSTQNPNGDQARIARALGVGANQVTILVEQIGGGFGGKQNRAALIGAQAAVAARALNRPVRLLYDRATDTLMTGKRHPYLGTYQVAF